MKAIGGLSQEGEVVLVQRHVLEGQQDWSGHRLAFSTLVIGPEQHLCPGPTL